ncbi:MAG TPA: metal-dependent hydrolase [Opitutaceae bacterium]|nr:metal-dependent hydrolase [Opitutaceae bacterium]
MRITFLGHACFLVETAKARLIIDPFLEGNSQASIKAAEVQCDYILLSHGHDDHTADALSIAQRCGATIVANFEIAEYFAAKGAKTHGMNPGGGFNFPFGRVKLTLAHHTSSMEAGLHPIYMGAACGILVQADGKTLYHAGDTALFMDMQLIGRVGLDVALVPIGDNYAMGPDDALTALDFLKPKIAVPMHYNTWPIIAQDAPAFAGRAAQAGHTVRVMKPGDVLTA